MPLTLIILLSAAILLFFIVIANYNKLNATKNQISNAKSSLDALFIKRSELIPNLVAVVKQYMGFEKETLEKITAMRQPGNVNTEQNYLADNEANRAFKQIMVQVENYPELKAHTQFTNLQYSWNEAEEQISAGRRYLSSSITQYNNAVTTFPGNMIAGIFGFRMYEWEQAMAEQRQNVSAERLFE